MRIRCMTRLRGGRSWPTRRSHTVKRSSKASSWRMLNCIMAASASYSSGSKQLSQAERSTLRGARLPLDAPKKTAKRRLRRRRIESNAVTTTSSTRSSLGRKQTRMRSRLTPSIMIERGGSTLVNLSLSKRKTQRRMLKRRARRSRRPKNPSSLRQQNLKNSMAKKRTLLCRSQRRLSMTLTMTGP